ncbi:MAG TPA: tetratricopeptide repeat protein [Verrucomicrobiae bacterium]|nr:tetratricopeptide repeat protein [Verrucomicrobiae bacterium]
MIFLATAMAAAILLLLAAFMVYRFAPEEEGRRAVIAEWPWFAKGFVLPALLWLLMNVGLSFQLQPFMPSIQNAQNAGTMWFVPFLGVMGVGLMLIASYWAPVTIGWLLVRESRALQGEARADFRSLCLTCLAGTALPVLWLVWVGGWFTLGFGALLICLPIAGYGKTVIHRPKQRPMYSRAIARMKFGKYADAEMEIIRQLEQAENDFDGWLMLAELYATQFKDIPEAEQIILEICDQPKVTPSQISVALHKLADWQIAVANDPEAADRTLQVVKARLPNTHLARMAELRRAQLPRSRHELQEQRQPRPIPLPALNDSSGVPTSSMTIEQATAQMNQLVAQLTRNPNNAVDRERLARLLAEPLGEVDTAIEQLELLVQMEDQIEAKRAEWLSLIATWQLRLQQDEPAALETLARVTREFPNTPQAFAAQRKISLLKADAAARAAK